MDQTVFIDWINIAQMHFRRSLPPAADGSPRWSEELPIVGDGVSMKGESFDEFEHEGEKFICLRPGEKFRYSIPSKQHRGSHSTSIRVRSDGSTVTLSGNAGRYDRPDNVFNYGIEDTVRKASACAMQVGLPAFTAGECHAKHSLSERDHALGLWYEYTGAVYRELHATRNYSTGNEALAKEYMGFAGGQRAARIAKGVYGDETIIYGALAKTDKPLHKALVIYRKAEEMLAHAKGDEAKKAVKSSLEYQFARDTGLVRFECKWGSHFLRDNRLRFMGEASMAKIISIFERETAFLLDVSPDRAVRLVSEIPSKLRLSALAWIRGDDLKVLLPKTTYFRHVKALRELGMDCAERRSGASNHSQAEQDLQAMLHALPRFNLRALECPEWYGLPYLDQEAA